MDVEPVGLHEVLMLFFAAALLLVFCALRPFVFGSPVLFLVVVWLLFGVAFFCCLFGNFVCTLSSQNMSYVLLSY
jgi:hypothetical protein